jgi:hypothetical protein
MERVKRPWWLRAAFPWARIYRCSECHSTRWKFRPPSLSRTLAVVALAVLGWLWWIDPIEPVFDELVRLPRVRNSTIRLELPRHPGNAPTSVDSQVISPSARRAFAASAIGTRTLR